MSSKLSLSIHTEQDINISSNVVCFFKVPFTLDQEIWYDIIESCNNKVILLFVDTKISNALFRDPFNCIQPTLFEHAV